MQRKWKEKKKGKRNEGKEVKWKERKRGKRIERT